MTGYWDLRAALEQSAAIAEELRGWVGREGIVDWLFGSQNEPPSSSSQ